MKKTDAKNGQERRAQGENTMRFRKETIEWKDDSTYHKELQREEYKWTRMLIKKEKKERKMKCK
jgi:hypothetical protein